MCKQSKRKIYKVTKNYYFNWLDNRLLPQWVQGT